MFDGSLDPNERKQALSALADGELDAGAVQRACAAWREDGAVRRTWRTYQLIGDVLRSDDLAAPAAHDEAFLVALRARLEQEPVVLAPQPSVSVPAAHAAPVRAAAGRRAWAAPVAVAAGFVAVAGVLAVTRMAAPVGGGSAPAIAALAPQAGSGLNAASSAAVGDAAFDVAPLGVDMRLVRDAYLDRYLAAHKQYGNSAAVSVPGITLRNAATFVPER